MSRTMPLTDNGVMIGHIVECPACTDANEGSVHLFYAKMGDGSPGWSFDGNLDHPTFSPSMLCRGGQGHVCHSFVRDGRIEYLPDCTHSLAGQTVELPEFTFVKEAEEVKRVSKR